MNISSSLAMSAYATAPSVQPSQQTAASQPSPVTPVHSHNGVTSTPATYVTLSSTQVAAATDPSQVNAVPNTAAPAASSEPTHSEQPVADDGKKAVATALTDAEQQLVDELEVRDTEVRQHEQAHANVGGQHTGAMEFDYTRGPDGRMYAISGEVSVDTSPVAGDPEATKEKMQIVIAAALAPAEPSAQDIQVAAKAKVMLAEATAELATQAQENPLVSDEADASAVESDADGMTTSADTDESSRSANEENTLQRQNNLTLVDQKLLDAGMLLPLFDTGSVIDSYA